MSILGNRVLRTEDPRLLTAGGTYVEDLSTPGALHAAFVRSSVAHARVRGLDLDAALGAPGVVAVLTAADLGLAPLPPAAPMLNAAMTRPVLADGLVRYVGEPIALVLAETRAQAYDAVELVAVDYEPLPAVVDPRVAQEDRVLLFPEAGTNLVFSLDAGHDERLFEGCEVVVSEEIANQRLAPCPLEVRACIARVEADGRLAVDVTTQAPHGQRDALARALGLAPERVRVRAPDVGGGFGSKAGNYPEYVAVAAAALRLGRPVRFVETRSESMVGLGHGRGQLQRVTIGGRPDGRVLAYRLEVLQDAGAYAELGAMLPFLTRMMAPGPYAIERVECTTASVVTNTVPTVAYRGAGRPEATAAVERAMDLFAAAAGLDPAAVRRANLLSPDAFPHDNGMGAVYDVGDYGRALEVLLRAAGYDELRAEQARRRAAGGPHQLGIGLSCYVEITNAVPGGEYGAVEVLEDGRVRVRTGSSAHGQGHATAFAMLVASELGVAIEDVEVLHGDTDVVPRGVGTFGSRSLQTGGTAVHDAAAEVVEKGRALAAELLEADPADVVLDRAEGRFHAAGVPAAGASWAELARAARERSAGPLAAEVDFDPPGPTFPFGAHLAVVEVDVETGRARLVRFVAVDDAGRILNPLLAEGQVDGGIAQGVAQALLEEFRYDSEGNPLTTNLADYPFISATELPGFETIFTETPTPVNALGAKGIGESGTIGSVPAVQNAVVDALSHLGVRHVDLPCTPERVHAAISAASGRG